MPSTVHGFQIHRHSGILIAVSVLATLVALATGLSASYSPSPIPTWTAGFPLPWKTATSITCDWYLTAHLTSFTKEPNAIPCYPRYETSINWLYLATDVLIYAAIGYALVPVLRNPKATSCLLAVLTGILATTLTSVPVFHEKVGTGYPTVYDKHGLPFPWLTYVTGGIVCGPGFDCPVGPRPVFNWVFLVFDTILYVAIASAALTIFRTGLLGQAPTLLRHRTQKTGQSEWLRTELVGRLPVIGLLT